jgi:hypothetical protein
MKYKECYSELNWDEMKVKRIEERNEILDIIKQSLESLILSLGTMEAEIHIRGCQHNISNIFSKRYITDDEIVLSYLITLLEDVLCYNESYTFKKYKTDLLIRLVEMCKLEKVTEKDYKLIFKLVREAGMETFPSCSEGV